MNSKCVDVLHQKLEVPEIVQEKAEEAFSQIYMEAEREKADRKKCTANKTYRITRLPRAAAIVLVCCLVSGTTAAAGGLFSSFRQRMEEMKEEEVEEFYTLAGASETTEFNRPFTDEEKSRYKALITAYESSGVFPEGAIKSLSEGESYDGRGIALDEATGMIYLPEDTVSDEELLQIIDFNHKIVYSIDKTYEERLISENVWIARLSEMEDAEVDRIYLSMFSGNSEISGGYSRDLTSAERQLYEELVQKYENEGWYAEPEITVVRSAEEYTGKGVALCVEDSVFYVPEQELSEKELLQIIDMEHKAAYCINRIGQEVQRGYRQGYPQSN